MIQLLFRVVLILLIPLGGLLVGLHLVDDSFQAKRNTSIQLHHRAMSDLALDHAKARAAREVEAHQVSLEAKQRREQELIVAAGGPADHAVKDPDLTISQMLERLALACAPSGSRATVKVDRFTEFELVIDIESQAVSSVLGEMTTCVLSRAAPYLHTIRFTRQNTLIAELTPDSLASVGDWSLLKPGEALALLRSTLPSEAGSRTDASPAEPRSNGDSSSRAKEPGSVDPAIQTYSEALNGQWTGVNHFVESLFRASGLGQYTTEDMLRQRLRELDEELGVFKQRRAFLENPIRELERLLREQGSDSLYIEIVARGERERLGSRRTSRESLFKAIIEHHGATKGFLEAMLRTWGQWTPVGDQIQFDSATTQNTYRTYFQRVQSASSVVNAAMAQL